jgi:hypothetical protein
MGENTKYFLKFYFLSVFFDITILLFTLSVSFFLHYSFVTFCNNAFILRCLRLVSRSDLIVADSWEYRRIKYNVSSVASTRGCDVRHIATSRVLNIYVGCTCSWQSKGNQAVFSAHESYIPPFFSPLLHYVKLHMQIFETYCIVCSV